MTLRVRLLSLMLAMVAVVAATITALSLNSLTAAAIDTAFSASEGAARQTQSFVLRKFSEAPAPAGPGVLSGDPDLMALLEQTMAQSRSIVEVNVAGADHIILASSNPGRLGTPMAARQDLGVLHDAGAWSRTRAMLTASQDYETRTTLGVVGSKTPMFIVQILVSSVFLRENTLPGLLDVLIASGGALAVAFALAWWSANLALRPLARISHLIDNISGPPSLTQPLPRFRHTDEARELTIIESKLSLLGERFRGAQEDATQLRTNLEGVLEKLDAGTRQHLEDQIALARRLTAINTLTGRAAHEIKNPLNSISLRLEILRSRVEEECPDSHAEFDILTQEIKRLDRVVRTFLDFNRPVELFPEEMDIHEAVAEIARLLEPEAESKGITLTLSLETPLRPVRADAGLLRQAILNISVNAVEAMHAGGRLNIWAEDRGASCAIVISDTGPGMGPEELEKIFQLYFTTKPQGTGIGLAVTSRAVQLMGGSIEVASEPGQGTTFAVLLPFAGATR
ncbi:MAG TPA: ATP-binding protein, partial [Bryobacteraceae bacterium]|nr:ATP-binding protein [Bryobacteraceae bacterium]